MLQFSVQPIIFKCSREAIQTFFPWVENSKGSAALFLSNRKSQKQDVRKRCVRENPRHYAGACHGVRIDLISNLGAVSKPGTANQTSQSLQAIVRTNLTQVGLPTPAID